MTNSTIKSATAAVKLAIDNQAAAGVKARKAATDSHLAADHAAALDRRLKSGDATVDIEAMIESKASAERLALLAIAYSDALPGYENVIREARTAETVARLQAGAIRDRGELAGFIDAMAAKLADDLETIVPELEDERVTVAAISEGLPATTAHNGGLYRRHQYRNGVQSSAIQVAGDGDSYEVDGNVYSMSLDVDTILERIVSELSTVMIQRKSARDLPALMAGRAAEAAKYAEQVKLDRDHREAASLRRF